MFKVFSPIPLSNPNVRKVYHQREGKSDKSHKTCAIFATVTALAAEEVKITPNKTLNK